MLVPASHSDPPDLGSPAQPYGPVRHRATRHQRPRIAEAVWIAIATLVMVPHWAWADLVWVREVLITPKHGRALANVGPVNESVAIRMVRAEVDIEVGAVPTAEADPAEIRVRVVFTMTNDSPDTVALTVGFPVSNSEYSAFALKSFSVEVDGAARAIFNRVTGYPWRMTHKRVSGPALSPTALPDLREASREGLGERDLKARDVFGEQKIGDLNFQNLMVWAEVFKPHQTQTIDVRYRLDIPPQRNVWRREEVASGAKGIWPEEANSPPLAFLKSIPPEAEYYFFDYYLVSGASWKGTIGEERITLRLDESWRGHRLFSTHRGALVPPDDDEPDDSALTYSYVLRDAEPTENLYFALAPPQRTRRPMGARSPDLVRQRLVAGDAAARLALAEDPATGPETLGILAMDEDRWVRHRVARHPDSPAEVLLRLARDEFAEVRINVAMHRGAPPRALRILASDPEPKVRILVAKNARTSLEVLRGLTKDVNARVSRTAKAALERRHAGEPTPIAVGG